MTVPPPGGQVDAPSGDPADARDRQRLAFAVDQAGLDEGLSSFCLPILVCMENPYQRNT